MSDAEAQLPINNEVFQTPHPSRSTSTPKKKAVRSIRAKSEVELLQDISTKLNRVIAVLAAQGKDVKEQILILASAGCDSNFIGAVVGKTGGAVRNYPEWRQATGGQNAGASQAEG